MLREIFGFEAKKLIIPAILLVVFFCAMLLRSPYGSSAISALSHYTNGIMDGLYGVYAGFVWMFRPGATSMTFAEDLFFCAVLLILGYIFSSAFLFVHRHNAALYSRGKKVYACVFVFMFLVFAAFNGRYFFADPALSIIGSLLMGYFLTSFVWGLYDVIRMRKIMKKAKKQKTIAKYFRWEFKYLK